MPPRKNEVASLVKPPAIALIVVASIALLLGGLSLVMDVVLLATGAADRLEALNEGPVSKQTTIVIRAVWGFVLLIAAAFVLFGAIQMVQLKNYGMSKTAAIVAVIPLIGPCCLLGIPFGIWALVALSKPGVRQQFLS